MDSRVSILGAIMASVGSALSWFCCLPIALSALGAGSALAATLGPLRPVLIGLSVVFWGFAFYALYRPGLLCREADCAAERSLRRKRMALWAAGFVTVVMITITYWGHWVIYWML